jgi:NAD(P)-dependent dehydrogenase (short-subunit alcohol dehydrogenase family)
MEKKTILITGASGGIGQTLVEGLANEHYRIVALHHKNQVGVNGVNIQYYPVDLTDSAAIQSVIQTILKEVSSVDVLINNAGISRSAMSWKQTDEEWAQTLAVNLTAPFLLCRELIPHMRTNGWGRIINMTSIVGQTGAIGTAAYAASKAGLVGLTKTLAKELAQSGVTSNALALGYFNTGMIRDVPDVLRDAITEQIPLKHLGEPRTVLSMVKWLMSPEAGYVTGQVLHLNGGMYM